MKIDFKLIFPFLGAVSPLVVFFFAIVFDRYQRKRAEKSPQTEKLLRPPGYSLSLRLEKTTDSIINNLLAASILATISGAGIFMLASLLGLNAPASYVIICLILTLPFVAGCLWSVLLAFRKFINGRNIRLGISGEQAVAESLNEAASSGFRVFHDLEDEKIGNIDHVAVGTRGIFLIETKARRRRASRNGQPEHEIIFDGEFLKFPNGNMENAPLEQAKINAKWLSNYLGKKTGEPVRVQPLVVLPGWFVRISAKVDFPVKTMNANYLVRFLQSQPNSIQPAQVQRIIAALDEKCRTVEF
jgi:hypothetical protein